MILKLSKSAYPCILENVNLVIILSAELQGDENELFEACRSLNYLRTLVMHYNQEAGKTESLNTMFSSGAELLLMFPSNTYLAALNMLRNRFHEHKQFNEQRESALEQGAAVNWIPPEVLQRIDVILPDGRSYNQLFPIELRRKDYMRRIIEFVALGIRHTVRDMVGINGGNGRNAPIGDFSKKCDLQDLLLHVLDRDGRILPQYAQGTETQQSCTTVYLKLCFH
jgi:hypothetical protein